MSSRPGTRSRQDQPTFTRFSGNIDASIEESEARYGGESDSPLHSEEEEEGPLYSDESEEEDDFTKKYASAFAEREARLRRLNEELEIKKKEAVKNAESAAKETEQKINQALQSASRRDTSSISGGLSINLTSGAATSTVGGGRPQTPSAVPTSTRASFTPNAASARASSSRGMPADISSRDLPLSSRSRPPTGQPPMPTAPLPSSPIRPPTASSMLGARTASRPPTSIGPAPDSVSASVATDNTDLDDAAAQMGVDAAMRFYKARSKALEEELHKIVVELKEKEEKFSTAQTQARDAVEERNKVQKAFSAVESKADKLKKQLDDVMSKNELLETQIMQLRKELDTIQKAQKQSDTEQQSKDVRLQRALEEVERYKTLLRDAKDQGKSATDSTRRNYEAISAENKRLQKFNADLLAAFKKQTQLISILKKQKMHLEAAKLLSFTEEEFTKTLELGDKM